ncbi:rossmann-like alpha/beta/alpha sandwich fold protein [Artemisia annua]|uniref:Rossmann-like alpha/beta/alpha sandwich fold protein n=1 Tax=Artemisia annua TaxID=35608 RepID=A0A2U1LAR0_ARTAN|nr:rossmann-like alpha/beta/alpha sandwich fold protein [Artemisia annua]
MSKHINNNNDHETITQSALPVINVLHDHATIMEIEEESSSQQTWRRVMSPEIVEVEEAQENGSVISTRDVVDVFVAVGKHDMDVVKWAIDHAVAPEARVYLVHVFSPVTHIQTPVGKLSRSQLSKEQVQIYINEENNKRRSLLQKYIRLCTDAKIGVETMLLESNNTTKAILDLISVVNITKLVIGTKRAPSLRRLRKGPGKGEFVKKNAPNFCEVSIIHNGKQVNIDQQRHVAGVTPTNAPTTSQNGLKVSTLQPERKFFECACFSRNFD